MKPTEIPSADSDAEEARRIKALNIHGATVASMISSLSKVDANGVGHWNIWLGPKIRGDKDRKKFELLSDSEEFRLFIPKGFVQKENDYDGYITDRPAKEAFKYLKLCGYKEIRDSNKILKLDKKKVFEIKETFNGVHEPLYKEIVTYRVNQRDAFGYIEAKFRDVSLNEHAGDVSVDIFDGSSVVDGVMCTVVISVREVPYKKQKLEVEGQ